jgi:hypothetical protein
MIKKTQVVWPSCRSVECDRFISHVVLACRTLLDRIPRHQARWMPTRKEAGRRMCHEEARKVEAYSVRCFVLKQAGRTRLRR